MMVDPTWTAVPEPQTGRNSWQILHCGSVHAHPSLAHQLPFLFPLSKLLVTLSVHAYRLFAAGIATAAPSHLPLSIVHVMCMQIHTHSAIHALSCKHTLVHRHGGIWSTFSLLNRLCHCLGPVHLAVQWMCLVMLQNITQWLKGAFLGGRSDCRFAAGASRWNLYYSG